MFLRCPGAPSCSPPIRPLTVFLYYYLLVCLCVICSNAVIVSSEWRTKTVDFGLTGELIYSVMTVQFDQDLRLPSPDSEELLLLSEITGSRPDPNEPDGTRLPNFVLAGVGSATLVCAGPTSSVTILTGGVPNNGPPSKLMAGHGHYDSAADFLGNFGGITYPAVYPNDTISFFYVHEITGSNDPDHFGYSVDDLLSCNDNMGPLLRFDETSSLKFADESSLDDEVYLSQVQADECTLEGIAVAKERYLNVLSLAKDPAQTFSSLRFAIGSFMGLNSYAGCANLIEGLYTQRIETELRTHSRCLVRDRESQEWLQDPCCNGALRAFQCCAPRLIEFNREILEGADQEAIFETCSSPKDIVNLISDHVDNTNRLEKSLSAHDEDSMVRSRIVFVEECFAMERSECQSDSHCLPGAVCDLNQGHCLQSPGDRRPVIGCLVDSVATMPDFNKALKIYLGFTSDATREGMIDVIEHLTRAFDCFGPSAHEHQARFENIVNDFGVREFVEIPADERNCLEKHLCNFNNQWMTQEACEMVAESLSPEYCGDCGGVERPFCHDLTKPAICELLGPASSGQDCASYGGEWQTFPRPYCSKSGDALDCFDGLICDMADCERSHCFATYDNPALCDNAPGAVHYETEGFCTWNPNFSQGSPCLVGRDKGLLWVGRKFFEPFFETKGKCQEGICGRQNHQLVDGEVCSDKLECSQECWGCTTFKFFEGGACIIHNVDDPNSCIEYYDKAFSGAYPSSWDPQHSICFIDNLPEYLCAEIPDVREWVACSGEDSCKSSIYNSFLDCQYNRRSCDSEAECILNGRCNDEHDFSNFNDNIHTLGACIVPATQYFQNGWECDANFQLDGYESSFVRLPYQCKAMSVNEDSCEGQWYLPSTDRQSCESHTACKVGNSLLNLDQGECTKCKGTPTSVYSYTVGTWNAAEVRPLSWRPRAWVSENVFVEQPQSHRLHRLFEDIAIDLVGVEFRDFVREKHGSLFTVLSTIACNCRGGSGCYEDVVTSTIAERTIAAYEDEEILETSAGNVRFRPEHFVDIGTVVVGKVFPSTVIGNLQSLNETEGEVLTKRQLTSSKDYSVVKNEAGAIVGQIDGNGMKLEFTGSTAAQIILYPRDDIPIEENNTITAVAKITEDGKLEVVTDEVLVAEDGSVSVDVGAPGTFFTTKVQSSWKTQVPAPIDRDCVLSEWSDFTSCDIGNCNQHTKTQTREIVQEQVGNGSPCKNLEQDVGCSPICAQCLSEWSEWSTCSLECEGGLQTRTRNIGEGCPDKSTEEQPCNEILCPDSCVWSTWTDFGACSAPCTPGGTHERTRFLSEGPAECAEGVATSENRSCNSEVVCDVDCELSEWGAFGECSSSCVGGTSSRERAILVAPAGNGATCGELSETDACNEDIPCDGPVDCMVSEWSEFGSCSASCMPGGTRTRTRSVSVASANGGTACPEELTESVLCNEEIPCVEDCVVSSWTSFGECSSPCEGGSHSRTRMITSEAVGDGTPCPSVLLEQQPCNVGVVCVNDIDCEMSEWSDFVECSQECGTDPAGTQVRTRYIITSPALSGEVCPSTFENSRTCNEFDCVQDTDCEVGDWLEPSTCPCGLTKERTRAITTPQTGDGLPCPPLSETVVCDTTSTCSNGQVSLAGILHPGSLFFCLLLLNVLGILWH